MNNVVIEIINESEYRISAPNGQMITTGNSLKLRHMETTGESIGEFECVMLPLIELCVVEKRKYGSGKLSSVSLVGERIAKSVTELKEIVRVGYNLHSE